MNLIKPSQKYIEILTKTDFDGITKKIKDEMAIPSYTHINPFIKWLMWERYKAILKISNFEKDMAVYEFGCGIGLFLPTLHKYTKKVYATDLYTQYAKKLSNDFNLNIKFVDSIDEIKEELNIIISADVLEHIEDLTPIILKWYCKLKENGCLIVSGPTENFLYKIGRFLAGFSKKADYHVRNIDEVKKIIENFGFKLVEEKRIPLKTFTLFKILKFKKS